MAFFWYVTQWIIENTTGISLFRVEELALSLQCTSVKEKHYPSTVTGDAGSHQIWIYFFSNIIN